MKSIPEIQIKEINDVEALEVPDTSFRSGKRQEIISGWRGSFIFWVFMFRDVIRGFKVYGNLRRGFETLRKFRRYFKSIPGWGHNKITKVGGIYWRGYYLPGWGSPLQKKFLISQLNMINPHNEESARFLNVYFSITSKCTLRCKHCSDWDPQNQNGDLAIHDLYSIMDKLLEAGTIIIHLTGGEPMLRLEELKKIMIYADGRSLFWLLTSGTGFTRDSARQLKYAGLTGVSVSLDHFVPEYHDEFRGASGAFDRAIRAVNYAIEQELVAVLSLCLTRSTANATFLENYMRLARDLGVAFVQILEPRAVGKYERMDVKLLPEQIVDVEYFFLKVNRTKAYKNYPIIIYHDHYIRRIGCLASGKTALYIDASGNIKSCPLCDSTAGNALYDDIAEMADVLTKRGCAG